MILVALLLVFLNGFFVLAEFAIVKVRKTRLEELAQQGNSQAKLALKMVSSIDSYLSAVQLGITLASLGLGWIGEPAIVSLLEPLVQPFFPGNTILLHSIAVAVGFTIITLLHVVLGELVPKSIAIQKAESMTLFAVWPLYIFHKIGYPIITVFDHTAWGLLKLFGVNPIKDIETAHSEEELRLIVNASQRGGVLDQMERELIDNVFDFADRLTREIMIPRQDMICLYLEDEFAENMAVVRSSGHTRYPLCHKDKDHVLGMVHIRDLMDPGILKEQVIDLRSIMRRILVVPEGMPVAKLLQLMRREKTHMAVVADEYGGTAGLVALEDIIEEIVGDIQDEHDHEETEMELLADGVFEFDGRMLLEDVADVLKLEPEEHEEDTIGGCIFGMLGRQPEIGDQVQIGQYIFTVTKATGFRVVRVQAKVMDSADDLSTSI